MIKVSNNKLILYTALLFLMTSLSIILKNPLSFSQGKDLPKQDNKTNSWLSKRDNLNVTMDLAPKVPIVDEKTRITFEVRETE